MPDFDVLTLSESRKRKSRSHGIRKKGNDKRKRCAALKLNISLNDLAVKLRIHGRHPMLSYLSFLPIVALRSLDTEANRFLVGKFSIGRHKSSKKSHEIPIRHRLIKESNPRTVNYTEQNGMEK